MATTAPRGQVLLYAPGDRDERRSHQAMTYADVARMIARLKAFEFGGYHEAGRAYAGPLFFVPLHTLVGREAAKGLGIRSANDLYGGVVPYAFVQTKAIAHGLVGPEASRPAGWSDAFTARVRDVTLPGFTKDADFDKPKTQLNLDPDLGRYRRTPLRSEDNRALRAAELFEGHVVVVESEHDDIVPHQVVANYLAAFGHAASVTHHVLTDADHGVSELRWRRRHARMLRTWFRARLT